MKKKPASEDEQDRFTQNLRREFMARQIRARGVLSLARLNRESKTPPSSAMLGKDIKVLNQMGFAIEPVESEGRTYLVDSSARHIGSKAERMGLHSFQKENVAMAAASLIFGIPDGPSPENTRAQEPENLASERGRLAATNPEILHWWSRGRIYDELVGRNVGTAAEAKAVQVMGLMERIWGEGVVNLFCDAGTTNERLGSLLRDVLIPTSFSNLNSLSLCTNSRSIFNMIADPEVCTKAVTVGGSQMGIDGVTEALAGPLTEAFLTATAPLLSFAFVFLGTTAIDVGAGFILSDSHEEKTIKGMVTSQNRAHLRVVCADRTKICARPIRAGYRFCSISPSEVDIIITNGKTGSDSKEEKDEAAELIYEIRRRGVPVIEAEFDTRKHPAAQMQRGQSYRSRIPFHKAEALFQELGFDMREDLPFQSRAMELWLNAVTDYFLNDAPEAEREKLKTRVAEMRNKTFLGKLKANTDQVSRNGGNRG